jgi:hypothetical protein
MLELHKHLNIDFCKSSNNIFAEKINIYKLESINNNMHLTVLMTSHIGRCMLLKS